jgi:hypothetical protein
MRYGEGRADLIDRLAGSHVYDMRSLVLLELVARKGTRIVPLDWSKLHAA